MAEEKTCFLKYDLFENGCIEKHWSAKSPAKVLYPQKSTSDVFLVSSTVYKIFLSKILKQMTSQKQNKSSRHVLTWTEFRLNVRIVQYYYML